MKKKIKTLSRNFPAVNIYLDDIDEIVSALNEGGGQTLFESRDYEFESIDELRENFGNNVSDLEIKNYTPYANVSFSRSLNGSVKVYVSPDSNNDIGLYHRLCSIIEKRIKFLSKVFNKPLGILSFIMFTIFSFSISKLATIFSLKSLLLLFVTILTLGILVIIYQVGIPLSVTLTKKKDAKPFLLRKKDEIIMLIVGASVALFFKYLWEILVVK